MRFLIVFRQLVVRGDAAACIIRVRGREYETSRRKVWTGTAPGNERGDSVL